MTSHLSCVDVMNKLHLATSIFSQPACLRCPVQFGRAMGLFDEMPPGHFATYLRMLSELAVVASAPGQIQWSADGLSVLVSAMMSFVNQHVALRGQGRTAGQ